MVGGLTIRRRATPLSMGSRHRPQTRSVRSRCFVLLTYRDPWQLDRIRQAGVRAHRAFRYTRCTGFVTPVETRKGPVLLHSIASRRSTYTPTSDPHSWHTCRYKAPAGEAPPWAMITPLPPPSGTTTWAVMEWDLFFRLLTEFLLSRVMPPARPRGTPVDNPIPTENRHRPQMGQSGQRETEFDLVLLTETGNPFLEPFGVESRRG
jgi:hypothetical protein